MGRVRLVGALEDEEESGKEGEEGAAEGESAIGMTGGTVGLGEKDVEPEGSAEDGEGVRGDPGAGEREQFQRRCAGR